MDQTQAKTSQSVIPLDPTRTEQASAMMTQAFFNYPSTSYIFPDAAERRESLPAYIVFPVRYCLLYGRVYTTPELEGVAAWLSPENARITPGREAAAGVEEMRKHLSPQAKTRAHALDSFAEKLREEDAPERHWYLASLAVDPLAQGRGIAKKLLSPVLEEAEARGIACYLETHSRDNLDFYRKLGFELQKEVEIPGTSLKMWTMVRKVE